MHKYINSKYLAFFLCIFFLVLHYYIRSEIYWNWTNVLGWDVLSYYIYLPATFIHHDPGMVNQLVIDRIWEQYNPSGTVYQIYKLPNGNWVSMYSIGFAILYAPFFFIAHLWATMSGGTYAADGFSFPYQYCIGNGVMLYIVYGIFVIRKVLKYFFTDNVTMLVMSFLLLGTNYFHEASSDDCMPHAMLFTAYALIIWLTIKWHDNPSKKLAAQLGLLLGFTILARGSAIICLTIPLLWNIKDVPSIKTKWLFLKEHLSHIIIGIIFLLIVPICQMSYWKYITGNFFFNSYQNTEGFDWDGQHVLKVLFSYKKSWFIYTPMIILPIIGVWLMRKYNKEYFIPIAAFFILNFYLISGWAAWWQGGSFGLRYFVESYAVMAIPFGTFISFAIRLKLPAKIAVFLLATFFLFLNLFQTWQFDKFIIDGYSMTKEYYWRIFLKTYATKEDEKYLEIERGNFPAVEVFNDYNNYTSKVIGFYDYEKNNSSEVDKVFLENKFFSSPPYSCKLTSENIYSPTFRIPYNEITEREHAWLRVSLDYYYPDSSFNELGSLVINFEHGKHDYKYKGWDLKRPTGENKWQNLTVDYLTPYPLSTKDKLLIYVYLKGKKDVCIDNLKITAYERKW